MSRFRDVFREPHTFLPVIHVKNEDLTAENARIAMNEGADGVFLINHGNVTINRLITCFEYVREKLPDVWVGLNLLSDSENKTWPLDTLPATAVGLWKDDVGVRENMMHRTNSAEQFAAQRATKGFNFLYFGGVAFKYGPQVDNPAEAAMLAARFADVVTTSGPATGKAPDVDKIESMKNAIGNHPLAIASGMTPENVGSFLPYADCFLVATGIGKSFTELDPAKVRAFSRALGR